MFETSETTWSRRTRAGLLVALFLLVVGPIGSRIALSLVSRITPILERLQRSNLVGVVVPESEPHFTLQSWWTGAYQQQFERWFNQNLPLRDRLVRINNQIGYSVFHRAYTRSPHILIGKDWYLYEEPYLLDFSGLAPDVSEKELEDTARDIAEVQRRFRKKGVAFILLVTAGKATICPEYLPQEYKNRRGTTVRPYDRFVPLLDTYGIEYLDAARLLRELKPTVPYPLFGQGGTHYNSLGGAYVARALASRIGNLTHKTVPTLDWDSVAVDTHPVGSDDDLAQLLNTLFPPAKFPVSHPRFIHQPIGSSPCDLKVSVVGGSFNWIPLQQWYDQGIFNHLEFYYYYRTTYCTWPGPKQTTLDVSHLDWDKSFLNSDVVVLEINESVLLPGTESHYRAFLSDALKNLPE